MITVFNRAEVKSGKTFDPNADGRPWDVELELEDSSTFEALQVILNAAYAQGVNKGSRRSGIFEVQTDDGIWSHINNRRIEIDTERKRKNVEFKSWKQLIWEEEQANLKQYLASNNLLAN